MGKVIDMKGIKCGYLTPLYYIKGGKWHCKCDCGNECDVQSKYLRDGHTKSCGCMKGKLIGQKLTIDMSNYEDEYIKVLERDGSSIINQAAKWKCICKKCGREFTTE